MRALIVTNDYPPKPGGIQQYLGNLVAHHPGPTLVLAPDDGGEEPGVVRSERSFMWPTAATRSWVVRHVREFEPHVVVYGAPHPLAQLGPGISEETGVPFVVLTHGAEFLVPNRFPLLRRAVLAPLAAADVVFAVSDFTRHHVEQATGRPVIRLGAGVDLERFRPADQRPERLVLGCVSRFVPRKGHLRVIEAAELLGARGIDVEVVLAGSGRLETKIRRAAAAASVPVDVLVGVEWNDLPDVYRRMSVFAMPARSRWGGLEAEGLGIVYLEAAASGLPVIAGTSGGAPETVEDGVTGFIADSALGIAEAIERMVRAEQLDRVGDAAREKAVSEFAWEAVADRWITALRSTLTS